MRVVKTLTVAAGTPLNIITGTPAAPQGNTPIILDRIFIQMIHGGTGLGYVIDYSGLIGNANNVIPVPAGPYNSGGSPAAELAPATSTAPGGTYGDTTGVSYDIGFDGRGLWVDGSHTGDLILVSYNQRT